LFFNPKIDYLVNVADMIFFDAKYVVELSTKCSLIRK